jgi:hypothetical protein
MEVTEQLVESQQVVAAVQPLTPKLVLVVMAEQICLISVLVEELLVLLTEEMEALVPQLFQAVVVVVLAVLLQVALALLLLAAAVVVVANHLQAALEVQA